MLGSAVAVIVALSAARTGVPLVQLLAMASMWLLPDSRDTQHAGCASVAQYSHQNHVGKFWLYNLGGLHPLLRAMRRFPDDKDLQLVCAYGVGGLSLFAYDIMSAAGDHGAVELVVELMRKWPDDPRTQIGGVHGCFMDFSSVNRARWEKAGGMELNVAAIRNHYENAEVQFTSWCAFSSGTQEPNQEKFAEIGGIELSVQVMRDHPKSFRVREEVMQSNRAVGMKAAHLRERQVAAGWIEEVATAMKDAPLDMHQQSPGCANLVILASNNETHRDRAIAAGAVELALEAVKNFPRMYSPLQWEYDAQYTVYYDCISLLRHLAKNSTARERLLKAGAAADVGSVMRGRPSDQQVQYEGAIILDILQGLGGA